MKKELPYSKALKEIEAIISEIEDETIDVDILTEKVKRAVHLIRTCKTKLRETEDELNTVLEEFGGDTGSEEETPEREPGNKLFND